MSLENFSSEDLSWWCFKCHRELVVGTVTVTYLGNRFTAELPRCPSCGMLLVTGELAQGKMAEVEQILEDK